VDEHKKELDVKNDGDYTIDEFGDDNVGDDDKLDKLNDLNYHDDEHKDKHDFDVIVDDEDDALYITKLDDVPEQCQQYHRVGHITFHFFYLCPCILRDKTNNLSKRCPK
jgi:hypothetical protein